MAQPPRHGHGGWSRMPTQAQVPKESASQSVVGAPPLDPKGKSGLLSGETRELFLKMLPHPGLTQVSITRSVKWSPEKVKGQSFGGVAMTVPAGAVYIFNDIRFWAQYPSASLNGASKRLDAEGLAGYVRFEVLFADRTPMQMEVQGVCPRAGTDLNQAAHNGWPFLNEVFGGRRVSAWAIYAGESVPVSLFARIDAEPDFPLTLAGMELAGFSLPRDAWTQIWRAV